MVRGGCNLQDNRGKKKILRKVLKRVNEGFSDKAGVLDTTDVFPKEADFLGSQYFHEGCTHLTCCKY